MSYWKTYEDPDYYDQPYDPEDPYANDDWDDDGYERVDDVRDYIDEPLECEYE